MSKGLAGAMIWSLETDDFTGSCNGIPFILLKTIVSTLNGGVIPTPPTPDPNAPTTPTKAPVSWFSLQKCKWKTKKLDFDAYEIVFPKLFSSVKFLIS